jgi:hypothetical protein
LVTQADYYVWKKHYGEPGGGIGASFDERFPLEVPEPASAVLLAWVMFALAAARWRL